MYGYFADMIGKQYTEVTCVSMYPFNDNMRRAMNRMGILWNKGKATVMYSKFGDVSSYYATPLDGDRCFFP